MNATNAIEKAAELGAEHGKVAAEAWCQRGYTSGWPVPDLSGDIKAFYAKVGLRPPAFRGPVAPAEGESIDAWDSFYAMSDKWETFDMECQEAYDAYGTAFTAAVEATVRSASDSDQDQATR